MPFPCRILRSVTLVVWAMTPFLAAAIVPLLSTQVASAQAPSPAPFPAPSTPPRSNLNWQVKTLGGVQFWTDVRVDGGWRVQQNSETGHFRLLDADNIRQAWGSQAACDLELDQKIAARIVTPYSGKIVILLHGLARSYDCMSPLAAELRRQGYQTINFGYASTRANIHRHAAALRNVIDHLGDEVTEINFVGHSLGNIVVRRYVGGEKQQPPLTTDPRIASMVMLGPPNHGSKLARMVQKSLAFKMFTGASGQQLAGGWKQLESSLGTPKFRFGVIAGGQESHVEISNMLVPGKDDFTVGVDEAKLAGATDFLVAPLFHSSMMMDKDAIAWSVSFLKHGYFVSAQDRKPVP